MKSKLLFLLMAVILVLSLVACGGNTDVPAVTTDPSVTTEGGDAAATTTEPAATTTEAPAVTEPPAPTFGDADYLALYVNDGLIYHLNFAKATEDSAYVYGDRYNDTSATASVRFPLAYASLAPFVYVDEIGSDAFKSGGTAAIKGYWECNYSGDKQGVDASELTDANTQIAIKGTSTACYTEDGKWGKQIYSSAWNKGYLQLGLNTKLEMTSALSGILKDSSAFTVETTMLNTQENPDCEYQVGIRSKVTFKYANVQLFPSSYCDFTRIETAATSFAPVTLTMAFEVTNGKTFGEQTTMSTDKPLNLSVYANGIAAQTEPFNYKADLSWGIGGERADMAIYNIRIYDRALTVEEAQQNVFADLAWNFALDLTDYLALTDAQKAAVRADMVAGVTLLDEADRAQKKLNNYIERATK